jgi:hypothetical protein
MANTFELIASSTVGAGGAASIDFTSIPSTYTDLCVKLSVRSANASVYDDIIFRYNNDSTSGRYSYKTLFSDGSSTFSNANTSASFGFLGRPNAATSTSNTFTSFDLYIPNYAGSTQKSSSLDYAMENNATASQMGMFANLYNQTSAITSIKFENFSSANFVQYSTAYLYGVKNA